jgi:hypothetical protein
MTTDREVGPAEYVSQVRALTQKYLGDLLAEVERLRASNAALRGEIACLETDLETVIEERAHAHTERASLRGRVSEVEATHAELAGRYAAVEKSNSDLANLYVAAYRIHGSLEREQVLAAIHEVLVNLIGTEDFAVLDGRDGEGRLELATSSGPSGARCRDVRLGEGPLGRAIERGVAYVAQDGAEPWATEAGIQACLPLRANGRVIGAVVVFELLAHKRQLDQLDHELFALLATHAALALHASRASLPLAAPVHA